MKPVIAGFDDSNKTWPGHPPHKDAFGQNREPPHGLSWHAEEFAVSKSRRETQSMRWMCSERGTEEHDLRPGRVTLHAVQARTCTPTSTSSGV